mmetsp:Transcript_61014/g.125805  ORF Transcript_61014/g.125805 Transcript_61014/m.125805 type:complete len:282 (+) Transcript_61014:1219-2064(+)
MCTDIYTTPLETSTVEEIINMPIPPVPTTSTVNINPLLDVSCTMTDDDTTLSQQPTQLMQDSDDETDDPQPTTPCPTSQHGGGTPTNSTSVNRWGQDLTSASCWGSHQPSIDPHPVVPNTQPWINTPLVVPAASHSAGEVRPAKRARFHEVPQQLGTKPKKWWDCEHSPIKTTSDDDLAEFLIGHSLTITFPQDFWPHNNGKWVGQAFDTTTDKKHFPGKLCLKVLLSAGPKARRFREHAIIPIFKMDGPQDVLIRRALCEQSPTPLTAKISLGQSHNQSR